MATVNMAYDHPQYIVNVAQSGVMTAKGAVGTVLTNVAFGAFCATVIKAVHLVPITAGTSTGAGIGSVFGVHVRNGTGVTGGTSTLVVNDGVWGTGLAGTSVLATATLSRGDFYNVTSTGTDFTAVLGVCIEGKAVPGANVTA